MQVMEGFSEWLKREMKLRGWSQNELARRADVSHFAISTVVANKRKPGATFCIKIAKALNTSPVYVLQIAGILPEDVELPATPDDTVIQEIVKVLRTLSPFYRDEILRHARYLTQFEQKE